MERFISRLGLLMNYAAIQERLINWPVTEFVIPRFFGRKWHFINLLFQNGLSWGWTSYNKFWICDNLTENPPIWPWFIFPSGLRNQFHQLKWFHTDHLGHLLLVCTDFKSLSNKNNLLKPIESYFTFTRCRLFFRNLGKRRHFGNAQWTWSFDSNYRPTILSQFRQSYNTEK